MNHEAADAFTSPMNQPSPRNWQLHCQTQVVVASTVERVWNALVDAKATPGYFMGARVDVGAVGEAYRVERADGWRVDGTVLAKEAPHRLRVSWLAKTPREFAMPNREVEFVIELLASMQARLTVNEYVDGIVPAPLAHAARSGWTMILRNLANYLDTPTSHAN